MSEDNHRFEPSDEINFEGDEEPSQQFREHMFDAFAHAAGHGPDPGKYRQKPKDPEASSKEGPADTKPKESLEAFCKRLGIKYNTKAGGVEISPYTGGNLLHRKPKKTSGNKLGN